MKKPLMVLIGLLGLLAVYLLQQDIAALGNRLFENSFAGFAGGRVIRFVLNDLFVILLIYGFFPKKKYVIFALYVQLAGIFFILLPYLALKYYLPGYNGPLISFLHRLVLNPLLMLMLLPAFYLQENRR